MFAPINDGLIINGLTAYDKFKLNDIWFFKILRGTYYTNDNKFSVYF
jgi:hypothetical protein